MALPGRPPESPATELLALQRCAGNQAVAALARTGVAHGGGRLAGVIERLAGAARVGDASRAGGAGPGTPLPDGLRDSMETAFGADFGGVRLHESAGARDMGAQAYTQGSHIHLAPGHGDAHSEQGRELIGHELAHVVQQRAGRVPARDGPSLVVDASLEAEADAAARSARASPSAAQAPAAPRVADPELSSGPMQPRLMPFAELVRRAAAGTTGGSGLAALHDEILEEYTSYTDSLDAGEYGLALAYLSSIEIRTTALARLPWSDASTGRELVAEFARGIAEEKAHVKERRGDAPETSAPKAEPEAVPAPSIPAIARLDDGTKKGKDGTAKLSAYCANCMAAGLRSADVIAAAEAAVSVHGWASGIDAVIDRFAQRLAERSVHATAALRTACFTTEPDPAQLVALAQAIPQTAEEAPHEIPDEDAFLTEISRRFTDGAAAVRKLWKTSPPGMRRTMEALMRPQQGLARMSEIDYLVEAIDPKHRTVSRRLILQWGASTSDLDIASWLDGQDFASGSERAYTTEYMTDERREEYRLQISSPMILKSDDMPLVGDNIFVLSSDGVFYGGTKEKGSDLSVHHSSFMAGKAVKGAGHLYTTDYGELERIDDRSGHYAPTKEHFIHVLVTLRDAGMRLADIELSFDERSQSAQAWLNAALPPQAAPHEESPFTSFDDLEASPFTAFEDVEETNVS